MTTTEPQVTGTAASSAPAPPRRPLRSRVSTGHLVMIVAGLVAVVTNYALLRADDGAAVALARGELPAGEPVSVDAFRLVTVDLDDGVLATLVRPDDLASLEGAVPRVTIPAGALVRHADLRTGSSLDGRRAMSFPVEPAHAAGGVLDVGDRVDVIGIRDGVARYLVAGAEVLNVPSAGAGAGLGGLQTFSVTIAVDDAEALQVALAVREGAVAVVRSTGAPPASAGPLGEGGAPAAPEEGAAPGDDDLEAGD
jgi:Flp pilus assembly protein CpaB